MQQCVQDAHVFPLTCAPSKPQGPCAPARAGAGAFSHCSTVPLPGEGSTAPGKAELILDPRPAGISAAPPPLGHYLGSLQCPYTHPIAQLYPTPSPCITFRVTQASCPGSDTVTCDKAPYQCSWPQQHQCPAPLPAPLQSPWLGWTKLLAQPLLGVGLKVTVMVAGPCAPAGTAEAGGHPTAPPQCVGTPGCSNVLHLWRWGHQHCHSVVLLSPSHSPPALEVSQGTLRTGSSSPG